MGASAEAQTAKPSGGDELPDLVEISVFGGGSFFKTVDNGLGTKHNTGGAFGARVTENFWKYVGLEQGFTYSTNNVTFERTTTPGVPNYGFGSRLYQWNLNPVLYFTPRGSNFRPYFTFGVSAMNFTPTDTAKALARLPQNEAIYHAAGLNDNLQVGYNYGGGVKWHLTDHFGIRVDVRGLATRNPTYVLPDTGYTGGVFIPRKDRLAGMQTTFGLTWYLGKKSVPPPPAPPAPKDLGPLNAGTLSAGSGTLCQGRAITIRSEGASDPAGRQLTYKWTVNGQPQSASGPELQFTPDQPGNYTFELTVEAPNEAGLPIRSAKANTLALTAQAYAPPTATGCQAVPSELNFGDSAKLNATGNGSACSTVTYKWTASEGTITNDTSAEASFDSKSVQFEQGGKIQSKTATVTATVTDDRGATANCSATIKVNYMPQAIRFGDVIFGKGSARVNNCGKRVLLEELAPKAADPDYEIVLIGHYDNDETPKGKRAAALDEQRVKNALAVLTGGKGTCGTVDVSRVKIDWVGTDQSDDFNPGICGTSARPATKERRGSVVSTADQNRRVEVWLVPKGTKMPNGFKESKEVTPAQLKKLGCPK